MIAPTLNDAILAAVDGRLGNVHACLPGRIETYDFETQKADVKPLLQRNYPEGPVSLPLIMSVPVVWPRGGGASLTFPLKKDDGVLLVFAERSLELWLDQGGEVPPGDARRFDLSDAIAIPGLNPFTAPFAAEDADSVLLKYNEFKIKIGKDGKVAIGKGGNELVDLVGQLCALVKDLTNTLLNAKTPTFIGPQPLATALPDFTAAIQKLSALEHKVNDIKGEL